MTLSAYLTVIVANVIGALSPGPDLILVTRMATKSRRHAIASVLGIQFGILFWCSLTVLGAAALLTAFPQLLGFVQLIGGSWLVWMGFNMFRGGWIARKYPPPGLEDVEASLGRMRQSFAMGLTTNLANPKIVLFLAALVAPMLPANPSFFTASALILGLWLAPVLLFLLIGVVVSTPRVRRKMLSAGPWIDLFAGGFFMVAGVALVISGIGEI